MARLQRGELHPFRCGEACPPRPAYFFPPHRVQLMRLSLAAAVAGGPARYGFLIVVLLLSACSTGGCTKRGEANNQLACFLND